MATTPQDNARKPRFDFVIHEGEDEPKTATLKELLDEINLENEAHREAITHLKSLGPTLDFISQFTGVRYKSTTESLPISTLKTIKLLYTKNDESGIQLFRCLTRPGSREKPTMEFRITDGSNRNEYLVKICNEILEKLAMEIGLRRLKRIETLLLTTPKLLECNEREIAEILEPIYPLFNGHSEAIARSLRFMTASMHDYKLRDWVTGSPLHEKIYTYLRTLPFFHWVGEHAEILKFAKIDIPVKPIHEELDQFARTLSNKFGDDCDAYTPITSINSFPAFADEHALALGKLIETATGIHSEARDILRVLNEANKVLHAYVFRRWHRIAPDIINLSIADCVAALGTIRHQQKVKTTYVPFWIGQDQYERTTSRLLSHLGGKRPIAELYEHDYIPQGAAQILHYRFDGFYAALLGQAEHRQARLDFEATRVQRYADCLRSNNVDCIALELRDFNIACAAFAARSVRSVEDGYASHDLEDTL